MRRRLASLEELGWVFRWADWVGSRGGGGGRGWSWCGLRGRGSVEADDLCGCC